MKLKLQSLALGWLIISSISFQTHAIANRKVALLGLSSAVCLGYGGYGMIDFNKKFDYNKSGIGFKRRIDFSDFMLVEFGAIGALLAANLALHTPVVSTALVRQSLSTIKRHPLMRLDYFGNDQQLIKGVSALYPYSRQPLYKGVNNLISLEDQLSNRTLKMSGALEDSCGCSFRSRQLLEEAAILTKDLKMKRDVLDRLDQAASK